MKNKVYYALDEEELEIIKRAAEITFTNYEMVGNNFPMDSFISIVEDLLCEVGHLQEELEDMERDVRDNYKKISQEEMYS